MRLERLEHLGKYDWYFADWRIGWKTSIYDIAAALYGMRIPANN